MVSGSLTSWSTTRTCSQDLNSDSETWARASLPAPRSTRQGQRVGTSPGRNFGPAAAHMLSRGQGHDRLELAASAVADQERRLVIDRDISLLESERQGLTDAQARIELS